MTCSSPIIRFSYRHVYSDNCSRRTMAVIRLSCACKRTDCHSEERLPRMSDPEKSSREPRETIKRLMCLSAKAFIPKVDLVRKLRTVVRLSVVWGDLSVLFALYRTIQCIYKCYIKQIPKIIAYNMTYSFLDFQNATLQQLCKFDSGRFPLLHATPPPLSPLSAICLHPQSVQHI